MKNQLLRELESYIEKHLKDDIIINENNTMEYLMPMRSAFRIDKALKDEALPADKSQDDSKWLEKFRKKTVAKVEEGEDDLYSRCLVSDEEGLEDYINKEKSNETFTTKLLLYIDKSKLSDAEIYKKAGIDRRHFSKIRCDKYYQPKKATAIALCMALKLNIVETLEILGTAGYSLSSSDTGDLVVKFCIERGIYDLIEVNEALDYFGQKLLGVV
ncbi:MAG: hypothetical protein GX129_12440 [Clostridiales bacterium]|jgi:hypothetical protein|nr:hypothetical protein [Clostridiales bacterium]